MAILSTGNTFGATDTVTSTKLNNIADAATFDDPVDDSTLELHTDGKLRVKASGVGTTQLGSNAVTTAKITNSNVTKAKIENVNNMKVLGNTSGSATAPQEVDILDEDDMSSDSATALATQQSIKAYFDEYALKEPTSGKTGTFNASSSWADLDLSTAVGANKAMVIMEVYGGSTGRNLLFRTNGSVIEPFNSGTNAGWAASGVVPASSNRGGVVAIVTDASGIVEYKANDSSTGINYNILAYQKLI